MTSPRTIPVGHLFADRCMARTLSRPKLLPIAALRFQSVDGPTTGSIPDCRAPTTRLLRVCNHLPRACHAPTTREIVRVADTQTDRSRSAQRVAGLTRVYLLDIWTCCTCWT